MAGEITLLQKKSSEQLEALTSRRFLASSLPS